AVVDLSKIKHLPLNHAAIMNAPVFDNRPCPMVLAVLAANLGAQKHDADSRFDHGPARHAAASVGCPSAEPLSKHAVFLEPEEAPGQLDHPAPHPRIAGARQPLFTSSLAAFVR